MLVTSLPRAIITQPPLITERNSISSPRMPKTQAPQNQRRIDESLSGDEIAALNEVTPGLGNKMHRLLSALGAGLAAQAGHKGTVGIKLPKKKDARGNVEPGLRMDGGRISDLGDPVEGQDAVPLKLIRRLIDPANLTELLSQVDPSVIGTPGEPGETGIAGCTPWALRDRRKVTTGLSDVHSVQVLNEFVYVLGVSGATPTIEVYRINSARNLAFVDSATLSQELRRTCLHGDHIYGAVDGAGSTSMYVISIHKPDAMAEVGSVDVTEVINDIHVQGRIAWLGTVTGVIAVDVSNPAIPVVI